MISIPIKDFLSYPLEHIFCQRPINADWVQDLKQKQYQHKNVFGTFCFPGSFVIAEYTGHWYLIDGQHRRSMLQEIVREHQEVNIIPISVQSYQTGNNLQLLQSIYAMANDRYIINGTLDTQGRVFNNNDAALQVVRWMETTYPSQIGSNTAPKIEIGILMRMINDSGLVNNNNVEMLCRLISDTNINYGNVLFSKNRDQYEKCTNLSYFFLAYKEAKCRWINEILNRLPYQM